MIGDNLSGADNQQERPSPSDWLDGIPSDLGHYVAGFVDGEGSFNVPIRRERDRRMPWRASLCFNVSQIGQEQPMLLRTVFGVFEDFRYTDELAGAGVHGLVFEARVGDRELQGLDLIRADADGRIAEFTVMIRPASGLMALAERMGPALQAAGV